MTGILVAACIALYLVSVKYSYGYLITSWVHSFPKLVGKKTWRESRKEAIGISIFGPIMLIVLFLEGITWRYSPITQWSPPKHLPEKNWYHRVSPMTTASSREVREDILAIVYENKDVYGDQYNSKTKPNVKRSL